MADFKLFKPILLQLEGLYANEPGDSGGETWMGISRNNYPAWAGWPIIDAAKRAMNFILNEDNIKILNNVLKLNAPLQALVDKFYECAEWDTILGDDIENQSIANFMADWEVNAGETAPVQHAQRILGVDPDGKMGPLTLSALNLKVRTAGADFFAQMQHARLDFYTSIATAHPAKKKFLNTWVRRTMSFKFAA